MTHAVYDLVGKQKSAREKEKIIQHVIDIHTVCVLSLRIINSVSLENVSLCR